MTPTDSSGWRLRLGGRWRRSSCISFGWPFPELLALTALELQCTFCFVSHNVKSGKLMSPVRYAYGKDGKSIFFKINNGAGRVFRGFRDQDRVAADPLWLFPVAGIVNQYLDWLIWFWFSCNLLAYLFILVLPLMIFAFIKPIAMETINFLKCRSSACSVLETWLFLCAVPCCPDQ